MTGCTSCTHSFFRPSHPPPLAGSSSAYDNKTPAASLLRTLQHYMLRSTLASIVADARQQPTAALDETLFLQLLERMVGRKPITWASLAGLSEEWTTMCQMLALRTGYEIEIADLRPALQSPVPGSPIQQHCKLGEQRRFECWLASGDSVDRPVVGSRGARDGWAAAATEVIGLEVIGYVQRQSNRGQRPPRQVPRPRQKPVPIPTPLPPATASFFTPGEASSRQFTPEEMERFATERGRQLGEAAKFTPEEMAWRERFAKERRRQLKLKSNEAPADRWGRQQKRVRHRAA